MQKSCIYILKLIDTETILAEKEISRESGLWTGALKKIIKKKKPFALMWYIVSVWVDLATWSLEVTANNQRGQKSVRSATEEEQLMFLLTAQPSKRRTPLKNENYNIKRQLQTTSGVNSCWNKTRSLQPCWQLGEAVLLLMLSRCTVSCSPS